MVVQGRLTDSNGNPVAPGPHSFEFRIFNDSTAGLQVWPLLFAESQTVNTDSDGLWTTRIGTVAELSESVFENHNLWLQIAVNDGTKGLVALPRFRLNSAPYAQRVATVDGATGGRLRSQLTIGLRNTNNGAYGFVAGDSNLILGPYATIPGGSRNSAEGDYSVIGGGRQNLAFDDWTTIAGGIENGSYAWYSFVGGGRSNSASDTASVVGGGRANAAGDPYAAVVGGFANSASGELAFIGGGEYNITTGDRATIGGGYSNSGSGANSTIGGGWNNAATSDYATVIGGQDNVASGGWSIAGGGLCHATQSFSCALGANANAQHEGTFVWADNGDLGEFSSTNSDQFLIDASNGVGINTNAPEGALHIGGIGNASSIVLENAGDLKWRTSGGDVKAVLTVHSDDNVYLDATATTASDLIFRAGLATTRMRITSVGDVGIGTNTPNYKLDVRGTIGNNATLYHSDRRWKKNVRPLQSSLDKILHLKGVSYEWKKEDFADMNFPAGRHIGVIAQDVEQVIPEVVQTADDGYKSVEYAKLVAVLIEEVKELKADNDELRMMIQQERAQR